MQVPYVLKSRTNRVSCIDRLYTRGRIIRLDSLAQILVIHLVIRL